MRVGKLNWMKLETYSRRNMFYTFIHFCILALTVPGCGIAEPASFEGQGEGRSIIMAKQSTPASPDDPILPQAFLDTKYVPSTKKPTIVKAGDDLQDAINAAKPGDTLMLEPGARFVGNFHLPRKSGDGFIVIRSGAPDSALPPEGTRITQDKAKLLPKIITPNSDPALAFDDGAHHYRFIAVEFTVTSEVRETYNIISTGGEQTSIKTLPHDLIFDRVYIHGSYNADVRRGIGLNSASTAVIDSEISDIHDSDQDSQAICGWNGAGPFKIVNNFLEAAGENVMFGGARATIPNLIASDIEFRQNHCFKPLNWRKKDPSYGGLKWSVKNLFEIKNAQRVLIEGNIFENNWGDAQSGFAILFTVRTEEGAMPWAVCKDITFKNNIVKHSASGIGISGFDDEGARGYGGRIRIENNLFDDINGNKWDGDGKFLQITGGPPHIQVIHNTAMNAGNIGMIDILPKAPGFVFTDNVAFNNDYGFFGSDKGTGNSALEYYFINAVFKRNVIIGGSSNEYPKENYFPANSDPKSITGVVEQQNNRYQTVSSSKLKSAKPDGRRPGVDLEALNEAIYGKKIEN